MSTFQYCKHGSTAVTILDSLLEVAVNHQLDLVMGQHIHKALSGPLVCSYVQILQTVPSNLTPGSFISVAAQHDLLNAGVLLVDSAQLTKAEKPKLGLGLESGFLQPIPAMQVPVTAAVWLSASAEALSKSKAYTSSYATGTAGSCQNMIQNAKRELGADLVKAFDLVSPCHLDPKVQQNSTACNAAASTAMPNSTFWTPATSSAARQRRAAATQHTQTNNMSTLQHALTYRLAHSASMQPPAVTEEAMSIIQGYYAFIRQQNMMQPITCSVIGPHTVTSLLRMATSCARLHFRHNVVPMPDVTLAIFLLQQSLKTQVRDELCDVVYHFVCVQEAGATCTDIPR